MSVNFHTLRMMEMAAVLPGVGGGGGGALFCYKEVTEMWRDALIRTYSSTSWKDWKTENWNLPTQLFFALL